jgi:hypothetical protein
MCLFFKKKKTKSIESLEEEIIKLETKISLHEKLIDDIIYIQNIIIDEINKIQKN